MNQTKKRLSIINLAISITDIETIQLQILKLGLLKSDQKIQNILAMLQAENYAQAQGLITEYIETPLEEIHQRSSLQNELSQTDKDIIEEFDLFVEDNGVQKEPIDEIDDLHAFIDNSDTSKKISNEEINYDTLLNIDADDILSDNIDIDISHTTEDTFFETPTDSHLTEVLPKDTFFDDIHEEQVNPNKESIIPPQEEKKESTSNPNSEDKSEIQTSISDYDPISYIDQKFNNLSTQYPPLEKSEENFSSVKAWMDKILKEGYTENEVEEIIQHIEKLTPDNKAEAAQLLLLTAATKSSYAQFQLARALYRGELLVQNIPEAFSLMNSLALNDDYAEAVCDLGQFYEYGIGIEKDTDKAKFLYKNAMELGIKRASTHYERLNKKNKGLFSFLKK